MTRTSFRVRERLALRRSGIHGKGVFARERIPAGTRLIETRHAENGTTAVSNFLVGNLMGGVPNALQAAERSAQEVLEHEDAELDAKRFHRTASGVREPESYRFALHRGNGMPLSLMNTISVSSACWMP